MRTMCSKLLLIGCLITFTLATDPDCLSFSANGAVTELIDDQSSGDTFIQVINI